MSEEGGKSRGFAAVAGHEQLPPPPEHYYGTFQGVANYYQPPPQPVIGFPQPAPPSAVSDGNPPYHSLGYQTVPGYAVAELPVREHRLPCCGIGIGWFLFLTGFFLGAIPWYVGAFILLCVRVDYREKPGLITCTLAAMLALIAVGLGMTRATHYW